MSIREAVILAAGYGTRLRPLTDAVPKPALPFLNRPILHWLLEGLEEAGVRRVLINLHHLPQRVMAAATSYGGALDIKFSFEPEILGTAGLFLPLRGLLQGDALLVVNGDIYHGLSYARLEDALAADAGALACLALREGGPAYTGVNLGPDGALRGFGQGDYMFPGLYAARAELLQHLPPPGFRELVPDLLRPLLPSGRIRGELLPGLWEDLGSPSAYLEASFRMLEEMRRGHLPPPAGSRLEERDGFPLLRHERAWLSLDATLTGPAVLGDSARVESRCHVGNAVLLGGTRLESGQRLQWAVAAPDCALHRS